MVIQTYSELVQHLHEQRQDALKMGNDRPVEDFIPEGEKVIEEYKKAEEWWPCPDEDGWPKIPEHLLCPTLGQLCAAYAIVPTPADATLLSRLTDRANAVATWMSENNLRIGETKEERKKRLNREGVARWQAKHRPAKGGARGRPRSRNHPAVLEAKAELAAIKAEKSVWLRDWRMRVAEAEFRYVMLKQNPPAD